MTPPARSSTRSALRGSHSGPFGTGDSSPKIQSVRLPDVTFQSGGPGYRPMTVISSIVGVSPDACAATGPLVARSSAEQSDTIEARVRAETNVLLLEAR